MARRTKPIAITTIKKAVEGNPDALSLIVQHYQNYIRALATRTAKDQFGNEYYFVDEEMRMRLEVKLICSIVTGFQILPA